MRNILTRVKMDILDSKSSMIWCAIAAILITALMVSFFPTFQGLDADLNAYIEAFPPALLEAFGIQDTDYSNFDVFIGSEYFGFFWAVVFMPFIVGWVVKFAKEAFDGSLGITLSYPISRSEVGLGMFISLLIKSIYCALLMVGTIMIAVRFIDADIDISNWFLFMSNVALTFLAVSFFGALVSILTEKPGKVTSILSAFLVGGYFVNVLAKLFEDLDLLKYLSIFYYYGEPTPILKRGELDGFSVAVLVLFSIIMLGVGMLRIQKVNLPKG